MTESFPKTETLHDALGGTVCRTVLPNGVRVLTEAIPAMRSVADRGLGGRRLPATRRPAQSGVSHFLEHLLFKGTERRSAMDISSQIEAVGGETNAFTAKEYTCYYARILDADLPLAVDVMCDVVANSVLEPADVETERGVILEEIAMQDDEPGDEVHDLFTEAVYGEHPLGQRISGSAETIGALTRDEINTFYRSRGTPAPSIVIAAAGNLDHDAVVARGGGGARRPSRLRGDDRRGDGAAGVAVGRAPSGADRVAGQGHRAGAPGARLRLRCPATTSAASPSAC